VENELQRALLTIVAKGRGRLTARDVDLRISEQMGPVGHVLNLLTELADKGLVVSHRQSRVPMSRWEITDDGLAALRGGQATDEQSRP
jgi:hypothetical protein